MSFETRLFCPDDLGGALVVLANAFGRPLDRLSRRGSLERLLSATSVVCVEQDRVIGLGSALSGNLAMPGGVTASAWLIRDVAVLPSRRRRGVMRALVADLTERGRQAGFPLSVLWPARNGLYESSGFHLAAPTLQVRLHGCQSQGLRSDGVVEFDPRDEVAFLGEAFEAIQAHCPGTVLRDPGWWESVTNVRQIVGCRLSKDPGFALYTVEPGRRGLKVRAIEVACISEPVRRQLWDHMAAVADGAQLELTPAPVEHVVDFARRASMLELLPSVGLALNILDFPAAVAARRYWASAQLVVEVRSPSTFAGCWDLNLSEAGGSAEESSRSPDVILDEEVLVTAMLGAARADSWLAASEGAPGALATLRAAMTTASSPIPLTRF